MSLLRYSEEAEQALIGSVLIKPALFDQVENISPEDFYIGQHGEIWRQINRMAAAGQSIDVISIAEALPSVQLSYLGDMAANSIGVHVKNYVRIVKEKSIERSLLRAANEIMAAVAAEDSIRAKVEIAQSAVMEIGDLAISRQPRAISEVLEDVIGDIQERWEGTKTTDKIGWPDLDRMASLFTPGALNIVAARPSMGKTAFAMNIAEKYARQGKSVLFCSLEMDDQQLGNRLLSSVSRIPLQNLLTAELTDDDFGRIGSALGILKDQKLIIDEQAAVTVAGIRTKARKVKRKHGLDLLVVDYLQLMTGAGDIRNEEIAGISRGLKKIAKDFKIPVIALSQLNRGVETRTDRRPVMADLRESGQIEQDADVILMLYRDEVYDEESPHKGIAEVICRKNRQGRLGTTYMTFVGELCTFESFAGQVPTAHKKSSRRGME